MSVVLPIIRSTRQFDLVAAVGQVVFTFAAPLTDAADLQVLLQVQPSPAFNLVTAGVTVTPAADCTNASVTFAVPPLAAAGAPAVIVRLKGARVANRTTNVTRGGVIRSQPLERELDLTDMVEQELRRDVDLANATIAALQLQIQQLMAATGLPAGIVPQWAFLRALQQQGQLWAFLQTRTGDPTDPLNIALASGAPVLVGSVIYNAVQQALNYTNDQMTALMALALQQVL